MKFLKTTQSLCPEDRRVLEAQLFEIDGKVLMKKTCPEHGEFEDVYWSDYELWKRAEKFRDLGDGAGKPIKIKYGCPNDCGLCENHKSRTTLLIIDVTNRCNLACPICFAHAGAKGYVYEPSKEQIRRILEYAQEVNEPVSVRAVQFSGGEPTVREDLPEIIKIAKEVGYRHVEVNTNGVRIAKEGKSYIKKLKEAGVSTFYLQFDGVTPEPYLRTRGFNAWPIKQKVIEYAREVGFDSIVLVPVLAKNVNDEQVGEIIRYGAKNFDVVRCINFQPISFTGRYDKSKVKEERITLSDFMKLCEEQTYGEITKDDFFPVPTINILSRVLNKRVGKRYYPEFTAHPHCGVATFVSVKKGKIDPITRHIDVYRLYEKLKKICEEEKPLKDRSLMWAFIQHTNFRYWWKLRSLLKERTYEATGIFMKSIQMISAMHFMDPYNFDLERVQSCCIHYGVPDKYEKGRIVPFCTMNSIHRERIEKEFSTPLNKIT